MLQVEPGQGRWSWPCCPGPTKPYVVRERAGYGDLEPATLDPLLDTVDQILSVSRDFQWEEWTMDIWHLDLLCCLDISNKSSINQNLLTLFSIPASVLLLLVLYW